MAFGKDSFILPARVGKHHAGFSSCPTQPLTELVVYSSCYSNFVLFSEKCKCPKVINANWYDIPPYIKDNGPDREPSGLFPLLLKEIVPLCCGNCSGGDGPSMISYANRRDNLVAIKDIRNFDVNDTITFPISGYKDDHQYQSEYTFMPLISSPGVAFIIVDEPPGTSANAVFNSVLSGWPVLLLTLLMALLSGIIMWGLVSTFYYSLNRRIRLPCLGLLQLCNLPNTTDCMGVSTNRISPNGSSRDLNWVATSRICLC